MQKPRMVTNETGILLFLVITNEPISVSMSITKILVMNFPPKNHSSPVSLYFYIFVSPNWAPTVYIVKEC